MKVSLIFTIIFCTSAFHAIAQQTDTLSEKKLSEVVVSGYHNPQPLLRAVGSVGLLDSNSLRNQQTTSLVGAVNTVPGARMEERSPGSYRLSLRGSLLRSPFGIRNIRVYVEDFPLTDAGGNTYLNLVDVAAIGKIEIYKGPEASNFGANTGGAVLVTANTENNNYSRLNLTAGSYGLLHQTAQLQRVYNKYRFSVTQGYQQSDGYREHSALKRKYIQTLHQWNYARQANLNIFAFYSDLMYETPGGLTAAQQMANPKSARPATATLPGAVAQQAAIYNRTFFGGLSNTLLLSQRLKHVIALFATSTDFKNPFITNFEKRKEYTLGLRTFLDYNFLNGRNAADIQVGLETANTNTEVNNFGNNGGNSSNLFASDDLWAKQRFVFMRANFDLADRLLVELGASLNFYGYTYRPIAPVAGLKQERDFEEKIMPKLAVSYLIDDWLSVRSSISKGYSTPTLAEVRSSDNIINVNLQSEYGWNYEAGIRIKPKKNRLYVDASVFYFQLKDAIVRRINDNDVEYFVNAGGTQQFGTEFQASYKLIEKQDNHVLKLLQLGTSFAYSHFKFKEFADATQSYAGNRLTGVPSRVLTNSLTLGFYHNLQLYMQHQFVSSIPLNDANTVFAKAYHLLDLKGSMRNLSVAHTAFDLSLGINNLTNRIYSLGNDLNAVGNRFFNPAATRNFYASISLKI